MTLPTFVQLCATRGVTRDQQGCAQWIVRNLFNFQQPQGRDVRSASCCMKHSSFKQQLMSREILSAHRCPQRVCTSRTCFCQSTPQNASEMREHATTTCPLRCCPQWARTTEDASIFTCRWDQAARARVCHKLLMDTFLSDSLKIRKTQYRSLANEHAAKLPIHEVHRECIAGAAGLTFAFLRMLLCFIAKAPALRVKNAGD